MGLVNNIRSLFSQRPEKGDQIDTSLSNYGQAYSLNIPSAEVSDIFEFLNNCGGSYRRLTAKEQAAISALVYEVFPFAKRALSLILDMSGNIEIVAKEGATVSDTDLSRINSDVKRIPILTEFTPNEATQFGLDNLARRIRRAALVSGMGFAQDRYLEGDISQYQGAMLFNPDSFEFRTDYNEYKLYYQLDQTNPVSRSPFFDFVGWDFREDEPWAHPLISGGRFFTRLLLAILVSAQNINLRKGFPVELSLISPENDDLLIDPKSKDTYQKQITKLRNGVKTGHENQYKGNSTNIVAGIPAGIKLQTQLFGAGMVQDVDPELLNMMFVQFANLLEVPPEVLGAVTGPSGLSGERFKVAENFLGSKVDDLNAVTENLLMVRTLNYLRHCGYNPALLERIEFSYKKVERKDPKEEAEIAEMISKANKNHIDAAVFLINAGYKEEEIYQYLEKHGVIESPSS